MDKEQKGQGNECQNAGCLPFYRLAYGLVEMLRGALSYCRVGPRPAVSFLLIEE